MSRRERPGEYEVGCLSNVVPDYLVHGLSLHWKGLMVAVWARR